MAKEKGKKINDVSIFSPFHVYSIRCGSLCGEGLLHQEGLSFHHISAFLKLVDIGNGNLFCYSHA